MNLVFASRLIAVALSVFVLAGCGGSGGEGGDGEALVTPEFDVTGHWIIVEPVDCASVSDDLTEAQLEQLNSDFETATLEEDLGTRVVQMGNDLELTDLNSGVRAEGTISGDQIQFAASEERILGPLTADLYQEVEGTVLDANRAVLTLEANLTLDTGAGIVTIGILCTYHTVRTS